MKTNREIIKRLEAAEKKLASTIQTKYVIRDFDGYFFGDCGFELSQEQFDAWVKQQEPGVEVTIMKYTLDGAKFLGKTVLNGSVDIQNSPALGSEKKR